MRKEKGGEKRELQASLFDLRSSVGRISSGQGLKFIASTRAYVGTKNEGFHRRSKGGDFGKSKFLGLGGVLETSFGSTTLQEVGILSTLVYFHPKGLILGGMLCRGPKG